MAPDHGAMVRPGGDSELIAVVWLIYIVSDDIFVFRRLGCLRARARVPGKVPFHRLCSEW